MYRPRYQSCVHAPPPLASRAAQSGHHAKGTFVSVGGIPSSLGSAGLRCGQPGVLRRHGLARLASSLVFRRALATLHPQICKVMPTPT